MGRSPCARWPTRSLFRGAKDLGPLRHYRQRARARLRTTSCAHERGRRGLRAHSAFREHIDRLGVTLHERTGNARFVDPHTIATESGLTLPADRVILCAGGKSRRLSVPGAEFTHTHSDAWSLQEVPDSMIVVGAGMTGVQVASIFQTFGSRVSLFQTGPRILPSEDEEVSAAVTAGFRTSGMVVREAFGAIDSVERTARGSPDDFFKERRSGCRGGCPRRRRHRLDRGRRRFEPRQGWCGSGILAATSRSTSICRPLPRTSLPRAT